MKNKKEEDLNFPTDQGRSGPQEEAKGQSNVGDARASCRISIRATKI